MAKRSKRKQRSPGPASVASSPAEPEALALDSEELHWKLPLRVILIVAACFWIYAPALHGGWLWDDDSYITDNSQLHSASGLASIWLQPGAARDYYPVEQTVLWIEWQLWGANTLGFHLVNVLLHIAGALLVWRLLSRLGLRLAWIGGLLFAIHPVQVESVAWMAELKNTLSLPLVLLAMIFYIDYDEHRRPRDYRLALGLCLAATLAKLSVVMLPVVLLLYVWWKRRRIGAADLKSSAPFFVVALVVGLVTIIGGVWSQQFAHLPQHFLPPGGIAGRLDLAGLAGAFYFAKAVLPLNLLPVYPLWPVNPADPLQCLPWLALAVAAIWFWNKRATWGRHAFLGLGFFVINLAPCPGFLPAPNMGYAWAMDHFLYLPIIGLIGLAVAACGQIAARLPQPARLVASAALIAVCALLALASHSYARLYRDSQTLWTYTLRHNPQAWPGHNNLGKLDQENGRTADAIREYQQALSIEPAYAEAHYNLGLALQKNRQLPDAIAQYRQALDLNPAYAKAHDDLGNALLLAGQTDDAIAEYRQSLKIRPDFAAAHNNLGSAFQRTNRFPAAIAEFYQAIGDEPDDAEAHYNLALALQQTNRLADAIDQYQQALAIRPDYAEARHNLANAEKQAGRTPADAGANTTNASAAPVTADDAQSHYNQGLVLQEKGQLDAAAAQYQQALRLQPDDPKAHYNLGLVLQQTGHQPEAIAQYNEVVRLQPDSIQARNNLAAALAKSGRIPEAIQQLEAAARIDPTNAAVAANLAKLRAIEGNQ